MRAVEKTADTLVFYEVFAGGERVASPSVGKWESHSTVHKVVIGEFDAR